MKYIALTLLVSTLCLLIINRNEQLTRIAHLESELRSVRYHYLKCSTALLDSNLHSHCFTIGK